MEEIVLDSIKFCKGKGAIDIGCGHGEDSLILAKEGFDVDSLDISENMLNDTKNIFKINNLEVKTIKTNILNYKTEERYDFVLIKDLLHFLDFGDIFKAIEKVKEITKIGGVNVIVFFVKDEKEIKLIKELYSEWDIKIINEYDYRGKRVFEICVVNKLT